MAEPGDIAYVRNLVSESDNSNGWTDEKIGLFIDAASNNWNAAADIWEAKAGSYSTAVDVTESGSSRKLGTLFENAMKMAVLYRKRGVEEETVEEDPSAGAPFTVPIRRVGR